MIPAWLRSMFGRSDSQTRTPIRKGRRLAPRVRLGVEAFEDRVVPANIYVDLSPTINGAGNDVFTPLTTPPGTADVGGLTLGTNLFTTIGAAVAAANPGDDILIANDASPYTEASNLTVAVNKALSFAGVGSTLANPRPVLENTAARFFGVINAGSAAISFDSLTLQGGGTGGGIAVQPVGNAAGLTVSVTDSLFQNNRNGATGGGAINVDIGTFTVSNTSFAGNSTSGAVNGGAIAFRGGAGHTVTGSSFDGNTSAGSGGAIFVSVGTVSLNSTLIANNTAAGNGGGVDVTGGTFTLTAGSEVVGNTSTNGNGGGIALTGGTGHSITGALIAGNSANSNSSRGGGVFVNLTAANTLGISTTVIGGGASTLIPMTNFGGNSASTGTGSGGGVAINNGTVTFVGNTIGGTAGQTGNSASQGGGVRIAGGTVSFNGDLIGNATAFAQGNTATQSAGIWISASAAVSFVTAATNVRFNSATDTGGGIEINTGTHTFANLNVSNNRTTANFGFGAGIRILGGTLTLNSVTVASNQGTNTNSSGGGIGIDGTGVVNANGTTSINNNSVSLNGGGVFVGGTGAFTLASTATLDNNTAANGGGVAVVGVLGASANVSGTVINNDATASGGGVFASGGTITLNGATIGTNGNANTAVRGGGIAINGNPTITLSGTTSNVQFNTATTSGGGIDFSASFTATQTLGALLSVASNQTTGNTSTGGGIALRGAGTLNLNGTTIVGNQANGTGSTGGGLYASAGTVNITGGTIGNSGMGQANTATGGGGGGIRVAGATVTITDGFIRNNTTSALGNGGGILLSSGSLSIDPTVITGNNAAGNGGGIYVNGGALTVGDDDEIYGNSATLNGGGIAFEGATSYTLGAVYLANNTAGVNGGGLWVNFNTAAVTLAVTGARIGGSALPTAGVSVGGNTATGSGGGVSIAQGTVTLTNTTVGGLNGQTGNTATNGDGGGVHIAGGALTFNGGIVGNATALAQGNIAGGDGGGLAANGGTINFSTNPTSFRFNRAASEGGGVSVNGATIPATALLSSSDNVITGAGGHGAGVAVLAGSLTLTGGTFARNSFTGANGTGGAFYQSGGTLGLTGVTLGGPMMADGNTAASGGAVHVAGGTFSLTTSTVRNNVATTGNGGGLLFTGGTTPTITGTTIAANTALATTAGNGLGGGIHLGAGFASTLTIVGSGIGGPMAGDANQAGDAGGAINVDAGSLTINGAATTIQNNTAPVGAGIRFNGTTLSLAGTQILTNTASLRGGGLAILSGVANTVNNALIQGNAANGVGGATDGGGGVFIGGGATTFDPTNIDGNNAVGDGGGMNVVAGTVIFSTGDSFTNNTASGNGGGLAYNGGTGHQINGTAGMGNSVVISGNTAQLSGGGIYVNLGAAGTLAIAFAQIGGPTAATDRNTATTGSGGGIHIATASTVTALTINNSLIQNNRALAGAGGGINLAATFGGTVAIDPTIIDGNTAVGDGGGINVLGGTLTLSAGDQITNNSTSAGNGGGIAYNGGTGHTITGTAAGANSVLIAGNTAQLSGGGVFVNLGATGTLAVTFAQVGGPTAATQRNTATTGSGGGIHIVTASTVTALTIANSLIQNNRALAGSGGGINIAGTFGGTVAITPTIIDGNTAVGNGGGINVLAGTLTLSAGDQITNNSTSAGNGGGIAYSGGTGHTITGTGVGANSVLVAGNTAQLSGGGIFVNLGATGTLALTFAQIGGPTAATQRNTATTGAGGGIHIATASTATALTINNSLIQNNRALVGAGGGINIANTFGGTVAVDPTIIDGNTAAGDGGGVNVLAGTFTLTGGDEVTNNTSTGGSGGGINLAGGTGHTITGALIVDNTATVGAGGGVNLAATLAAGTVAISTTTIGGSAATTNPTVDGNSAGTTGGGINVLGGILTLTTNTIGGVGTRAGNVAGTLGGGIHIGGGIVNLTGGTIGGAATINGNSAPTGGGINYAAGTLTFVGAATTVRFNHATGGMGGGMNITAAVVVNVTNGTDFLDNDATTSGGGIAHNGTGLLTITNADVLRNTATGMNGGGVFSSGTGNVTINTSTVSNNTATAGSGGGVFSGGGVLTITGSTIASNTAGTNGGGVFTSGGNITNTTIGGANLADGNTAGVSGGGLFVNAGSVAVVVNAAGPVIRNNTATNGSGGGIFIGAATAVSVSGTAAVTASIAANRANNAAGSGGGIHMSAAFANTLTLSFVTIGGAAAGDGNTTGGAGGGINVAGGNLSVTANASATNRISFNTAGTTGGGINVATGGNVTFAGTPAAGDTIINQIDNNTATTSGGGVHIASGNVAFNGQSNFPTVPTTTVITNFINNTAAIGGGLNQAGGTLAITVATFAQNDATTGNGGGMNLLAGLAPTLTRITFSANTAPAGFGGGVAITSGVQAFNNTTFSLNTAATGGAFAMLGASTTSVVNTTMTANTATTATGGLRVNAGALTIQNSLLGNNTGPGATMSDIVTTVPITDSGNNLFESFAGFAPVGTDVTGVDPLVAALGSYGGPNQTVALLPGSPAINTGVGVGPDQRGIAIVGTKDIGAFESSGFTFANPTGSGQQAVVNTNFGAPLSIQVVANNPLEPVNGGRVTFTANTVAGATATIAGNVATITAGVATTGAVTANNIFGTYTVDIASPGVQNPPPPPVPVFTLTNLGVDTITFANALGGQQPTNTVSGQVINATVDGVIVQLLDQFGVPLPLAGINVTLMVNTGPGSLVPTAVVSTLTDATGKAFFSPLVHAPNAAAVPLVINTTGTYTLIAEAPRNTLAPSTDTDVSTPFNITASNLLIDAIPTPIRSGAFFNVTVRAVGVDNSVDPNFNSPVTLGINAFNPTAAGGPAPTLGGTNPVNAAAGIANFANMTLDRGGQYILSANSGALIQGLSNAIKINASAIGVMQPTSLGSLQINPSTGLAVMPPNSVRSSAQGSIVDPNKDVLNVTVVGTDVLGFAADIDAQVTLSVNSATQVRNGVLFNTNDVFPGGIVFGGATSLPAFNTPFLTYGVGNANLTLNRWGDYTLLANANDGLTLNSNAVSPGFTVIARQIFVVNAPTLAVGPFTIRTEARDITGDIAQNYNGPSDPTRLTISDLFARGGDLGITGRNGTVVSGNVSLANPVRGVTTFELTGARPILVAFVAIDNNEYFIANNSGGLSLDTLAAGRRRPRPLPTTITGSVRLR